MDTAQDREHRVDCCEAPSGRGGWQLHAGHSASRIRTGIPDSEEERVYTVYRGGEEQEQGGNCRQTLTSSRGAWPSTRVREARSRVTPASRSMASSEEQSPSEEDSEPVGRRGTSQHRPASLTGLTAAI